MNINNEYFMNFVSENLDYDIDLFLRYISYVEKFKLKDLDSDIWTYEEFLYYCSKGKTENFNNSIDEYINYLNSEDDCAFNYETLPDFLCFYKYCEKRNVPYNKETNKCLY